jgi:hypothetical protein
MSMTGPQETISNGILQVQTNQQDAAWSKEMELISQIINWYEQKERIYPICFIFLGM